MIHDEVTRSFIVVEYLKMTQPFFYLPTLQQKQYTLRLFLTGCQEFSINSQTLSELIVKGNWGVFRLAAITIKTVEIKIQGIWANILQRHGNSNEREYSKMHHNIILSEF